MGKSGPVTVDQHASFWIGDVDAGGHALTNLGGLNEAAFVGDAEAPADGKDVFARTFWPSNDLPGGPIDVAEFDVEPTDAYDDTAQQITFEVTFPGERWGSTPTRTGTSAGTWW